MRAIQHETNNDVLQPPRGASIEECRPLFITRFRFGDGSHGVMSYWQPNAEELAALNEGKPAVLVFQGQTHPPLQVAIYSVDPDCG